VDELADFVLNYCREAGAIVEPPAYGVHEVLLPDDLAGRLGVSAYQHFAFDDALAAEADETDEVTHLSYGHPLVESLIEVARQAPACAHLYVNAVRLDKRGLAELARQALSFPNARLVEVPRPEQSRRAAEGPDQTEGPALGHYVRFNFKAALITDEKHEQLLSVLMDAQGGYAVNELAEIERLTTLETTPAFEHLPVMPLVWLPGEEPLSCQALEGMLERAKRAALDQLAEPLDSLQQRAARFLELDRARLEQYYDDMQRDLTRRLERADEDRRKALEDKLATVQADREAKLADAEAKYRLRVELELINLLVIAQPRLVLPVKIENRTATITRTVMWNPLLHRIEPLACDVCGRASFRLFLCTGGHLAHEECLSPQCVDCKRVYCRLCNDQMKACVVCDRPVCASSLNLCPICGRGTCREHMGLCHAAKGEPARILSALSQAEKPTAPPPELEKVEAVRLSAHGEAPPTPPVEKKPEKKPKPPAPPAERQVTKSKRIPPPRRATAIGQRIEVYTHAAEPAIDAFVIASGGRELARRTWQLVEDGIAVWCQCEKGLFCQVNQTVFEPRTADEIEGQLQVEIEALQQEYQVSGKRISFYYVLHDVPRPERRLLLRGQWKDDAALSKARTAFRKTYASQRPRQY
jgi:hypothetical protein